MKNDVASYFPEAFKLLHESRFREVTGVFEDRMTGHVHEVSGLKMDDFSWEACGWLLNWLHLAHSRPGVALRVPLILIEGPPQSGKSWLLQRLAEIAGCRGLGVPGGSFPPTEGLSKTMVRAGLPLWVFDCPVIIGHRGVRQLDRWSAFENLLDCDLYSEPPRKGQTEGKVHVLRTVMVLSGPGPFELPADLERRSVRIRLQARQAHAEA